MSETLEFTAEVEKETAPLYERVKSVIPEFEWRMHAPYIAAINRLKKEIGAVVLAHNYQTPEIFHCVSDFSGDSLQLAREAAKTDAKIIVQAGVHFMAETSKILSPEKTVLIPDMGAGWPVTGATPRSTNRTFMPASTSRAPAWAPPRPVPITIASQWTESTAWFASAA